MEYRCLPTRLIRMMRSLSRGAEASFVNAKNCEVSSAGTATFLMVILQPSLIVVDHGHFQYNSVCLGLAMGAAATLVSGGRRGGEVKRFVARGLVVFVRVDLI